MAGLIPTIQDALVASDKVFVARHRSNTASGDENGVNLGSFVTPNIEQDVFVDYGFTASNLDAESLFMTSVDRHFFAGGHVTTPAPTAKTRTGTPFLFESELVATARVKVEAGFGGHIDVEFKLTGTGSLEYRHVNMPICRIGAPAFIPIVWQQTDIAGGKSRLETYVDGLLIRPTEPPTDWASTTWTPLEFRAPIEDLADSEGRSIVDTALLSQYVPFPADFISILIFGTSLMTEGGQPNWIHDPLTTTPAGTIGGIAYTTFVRPEWIPLNSEGIPNGYQTTGSTPFTSPLEHDDRGSVTTIFRNLHKAGIATAENKNCAQSGATLSQILGRITQVLVTDGDSIDWLFGGGGTNELGTAFPSGPDFAAMETTLDQIIAVARNAGARGIFWSKTASIAANQTKFGTPSNSEAPTNANVYADNVDRWHEILARKVEDNPGFFFTPPTFEAHGGHEPDLLHFKTDNVHYSTLGSNVEGNVMTNGAVIDTIKGLGATSGPLISSFIK